MEYLYAALLLHKLKKEISEASVKKVVHAAGVTPDEIKVKALVSALGEVNIDEVLKNAVFAPVAPTPVAATPTPSPTGEAKKPVEEEKKEEALEGLSSLFG